MLLVHFHKEDYFNNLLPKFLELFWDSKIIAFFNPYMPSVLFVGHRQTVYTEIRCHKMRGLTRVSTVCLHNFLLNLNKNEKYYLTTLTEMDCSSW